jgi:hypothetical protein
MGDWGSMNSKFLQKSHTPDRRVWQPWPKTRPPTSEVVTYVAATPCPLGPTFDLTPSRQRRGMGIMCLLYWTRGNVRVILILFTPQLISSTALGITGELTMSYQTFWNPMRRISIPGENTKKASTPH